MQFWRPDLSLTDSIMQECYSVFGPEPRPPSCMLRSYLLALKLKVTSITVWCRMLRENPLYAILSRFPFGDRSGAGAFYGFFSRIWQDDSDNLSLKDRFPRIKIPKEKRKAIKLPAILPKFNIEKLLLYSAHDAYAVYEYCKREDITPFIDLNPGHTGTSRIRMISPLMMTASQSAKWAYACIKMDMKLPNTVQSTGVQKRTENRAASVNIPVHRQNMA